MSQPIYNSPLAEADGVEFGPQPLNAPYPAEQSTVDHASETQTHPAFAADANPEHSTPTPPDAVLREVLPPPFVRDAPPTTPSAFTDPIVVNGVAVPPAELGCEMPGSFTACLPPTDTDEGEEECKGFVSSRQWVAEAAATMLHYQPLDVELVRGPAIRDYDGNWAKESLCTFDTTKILTTPQLLRRFDAATGELNLRNYVHGVKKGVLRTVRRVGLTLERFRGVVEVVDCERLARPTDLVVEPAYAAAFVNTTDEATVKARRAISMVFRDADARMVEVVEVCRHGRELLDSKVEVTRYTMRLAALVVECAMRTMCNGRAVWEVADPAARFACGSWMEYRRRMQNDVESQTEVNYVPWMAMKAYQLPAEMAYGHVLRFACADAVVIRDADGEWLPPVVWPAIPNCVFYSDLIMTNADDNRARWDFSDTDVYVAARMWCYRYGSLELLDQMIQLYMLLYWQTRSHRVGLLVLPGEYPSIALPAARMRSFIMAPYLQLRDSTVAVACSVGVNNTLEKISEATLAALLIGFAVDWCKWHTMDCALSMLQVNEAEIAQFSMVVRRGELGVPIWAIAQKWLNDCGYPGDLGVYLSHLAVDDTDRALAAQARTLFHHRINSADLLGWFKKVVIGSAAQGYIAPVAMPEKFTQVGNMYQFSDLGKDTQMRAWVATLMETEGVELVRSIQDRYSPNLVSRVNYGSPDLSCESGVADRPFMAVTLKSGCRIRWGYRLNFLASHAMRDAAHDRFHLEWFIAPFLEARITYKPIQSLRYPGGPDIPPTPPQHPGAPFFDGDLPPNQFPPRGRPSIAHRKRPLPKASRNQRPVGGTQYQTAYPSPAEPRSPAHQLQVTHTVTPTQPNAPMIMAPPETMPSTTSREAAYAQWLERRRQEEEQELVQLAQRAESFAVQPSRIETAETTGYNLELEAMGFQTQLAVPENPTCEWLGQGHAPDAEVLRRRRQVADSMPEEAIAQPPVATQSGAAETSPPSGSQQPVAPSGSAPSNLTAGGIPPPPPPSVVKMPRAEGYDPVVNAFRVWLRRGGPTNLRKLLEELRLTPKQAKQLRQRIAAEKGCHPDVPARDHRRDEDDDAPTSGGAGPSAAGSATPTPIPSASSSTSAQGSQPTPTNAGSTKQAAVATLGAQKRPLTFAPVRAQDLPALAERALWQHASSLEIPCSNRFAPLEEEQPSSDPTSVAAAQLRAVAVIKPTVRHGHSAATALHRTRQSSGQKSTTRKACHGRLAPEQLEFLQRERLTDDDRRTMVDMRLRDAPADTVATWACQRMSQLSPPWEREIMQWVDAMQMRLGTHEPTADSPLIETAESLQQPAELLPGLKTKAAAVLRDYAWPTPKYTPLENEILNSALLLAKTDLCRDALSCTRTAAPTLDSERQLRLAVELNTAVMEWKMTFQMQQEARDSLPDYGLRPSGPCLPLAQCDCLFCACPQTGTTRTHRECAIAYQLGGCPKTLVQRFGGRWPGLREDQCHCSTPLTGVRAIQWFNSLAPRQQAAYLVECHPAVVGPEHYRRLGAKTSLLPEVLPEPIAFLWENAVTRHFSERECVRADVIANIRRVVEEVDPLASSYQTPMMRRKTQGGFPYTYTAKMLSRVDPDLLPLIEFLHNRSPDSDESEVCGTAVALGSLPPRVIAEILRAGWLEVPLDQWHDRMKWILVRARRTMQFGKARADEVMSLRKLLNVTIRRNGDSDFGMENYHRTALITRKHWYGHWAPDNNGQSAFTKYEELFTAEASQICAACFQLMPRDITSQTLQEFWDERALRGAVGASRTIKKLDLSDIKELAPPDRVGKRVLVEMLDDAALLRALNSEPMNRAYYFVKPEPGLKLRSLFAAYDEEAFISAYANRAVENYMRAEPGVMVRQTPKDVAEWLTVSDGGLGGPEGNRAYWLSTDYSDYNSEHTVWEMCALDYACGLVFEEGRVGAPNPDKAAAHYWGCAGRRKTAVIYGTLPKFNGATGMLQSQAVGSYCPMINGLYSGSRTTARDNTWIHAVDIRLARRMLRDRLEQDGVRWTALCGDDEDIALDSEFHAAIYFATLSPSGHNLNAAKQLAGHHTHEFLQMGAVPNARIDKPLCTLLATLATGNWYVQSGVWLQTILNGVIANYWECFCRGMPLQLARRLAAATLDRSMHAQVRGCEQPRQEGVSDPVGSDDNDATITKELEWWTYRHAAGLPPLFRWNPGDTVEPMPRYEAVAEPTSKWPGKASQRYAAMHKPMLDLLPDRIWGEFVAYMQQQTVGSALRTWQQSQARRWCFEHWPARRSDGLPKLDAEDQINWEIATPDKVDLSQFRYGLPRAHGLLTEPEVCGRMGVPFFLARKLGGAAALGGKVPLESWARFTDTSSTFYPLSADGYRLQMNLRACATWATAPIESIHGSKVCRSWGKITYVYMGNGAGKTTFCRVHRQAQDIDSLWLDLFGMERLKFSGQAANSGFHAGHDAAAKLLEAAAKRGPMLLGHIPPHFILEAAKRVNIEVRVCSFDPGEETRRSRISNRRWPREKVEDRMERSNMGYRQAAALGAIKLENYAGLAREYGLALGQRLNADLGLEDASKIPAKYIFNASDALSRKLEIDEEAMRVRGYIANAADYRTAPKPSYLRQQLPAAQVPATRIKPRVIRAY